MSPGGIEESGPTNEVEIPVAVPETNIVETLQQLSYCLALARRLADASLSYLSPPPKN